MTASSTFDVIFVGAGHNALIAASYLVKEGRSVCLLDLHPTPGGWVRSEELTLPGFVHDTFSALHPIFVGGPVFAELGPELAEHGLRYVQGQTSTGASFPDGRSALIETDPDALAAELDRLGERHAWTQLMTAVSPHLDSLGPLLGMDLASPEAAGLLRMLCRDTGSSVPFTALLSGSGRDLLGDRFASEELIMAWLPWLLHVGLGPHDAGGALWSVLLMATLLAGNPAPVGGSGRLAEALTALVTAHGAEIRTGVEVDAIVTTGRRATGVRTTDGEQLTATQAVIASTHPTSSTGACCATRRASPNRRGSRPVAIGTAAAASRSASRCRRDPASRILDSTPAAGSTWDAASTNSWPPLGKPPTDCCRPIRRSPGTNPPRSIPVAHPRDKPWFGCRCSMCRCTQRVTRPRRSPSTPDGRPRWPSDSPTE